ncbi:unnamed protein product [Schistosoma mattheei]|uniref:Uncharacterized protein n=1 Tax=Schistosoma mattheei TaxID=31246 RepID=A0A183Q526_9TREM|nr:unnamed protein product [Schistosoma mattheei]
MDFNCVIFIEQSFDTLSSSSVSLLSSMLTFSPFLTNFSLSTLLFPTICC